MTITVKLSELFSCIDGVSYAHDATISDLQVDSRKVTEGSAFIALAGSQVNGVDFIPDARAHGAQAIMVDASQELPSASTANVVTVQNLQAKVSEIAGAFYGHPSQAMNVVGVTGTNGKSTIVSLIAQLMAACGKNAATVGTLGYGLVGEPLTETGMTTPDAVLCQKILFEMRRQQANIVAMEVSSHGIDQNRVAAIQFGVAVVSNITRDHLDYHSSFEHYVQTKFSLLINANTKRGVINIDDPACRQFTDASAEHSLLTYSVENANADIYAEELEYTADGFKAKVISPWGGSAISCSLVGYFNVSNVIASIAVCCALGEDFQLVCKSVSLLTAVPGRLQKVQSALPNAPSIFIDYAHTPDALQNVLQALQSQVQHKLWVVFGCGGDRDKGKRPEMGKVAENLADVVVLTSDNPRTEQPAAILRDIEAGVTSKQHLLTIEDRAKAIEYAVTHAEANDVVLIAGKGHENYQIIGKQKFEFDDYATALAMLNKRGDGTPGGAACH